LALVATSGPAMAQKVDGFFPNFAVSKFITLLKDLVQPEDTFEYSMSKNFDGTKSYAARINAEFKRRNMPAPFE